MEITLESIISLLDAKGITVSVHGGKKSVKKISAIAPQVKDSLCYYVGDDLEKLSGVKDSIVFCKPTLEIEDEMSNTFVLTEHPQLCFYHSSTLFKKKTTLGIHEQAVIDRDSVIGMEASIGPNSVIEKSIIGDNVIIDSGVKVYEGTVIGNNVHILSGTVIGSIGTLWTWDRAERMIPCNQTGKVIIEDEVFVASNVSIARGSYENTPTIIGKGTMISNGTAIGHSSVIGTFNHFGNNVTLGGSVKTGDKCFFGSGSVVRPHITIPESTIVGAGAVVVKDYFKTGLVLAGNPARILETENGSLSGVPDPY